MPLLALMLAAFGIGTTEYVIVGLLPDMAADMHVSIAQAGLIITWYSLGVAFGSPLVAMSLVACERRVALILLMILFTVGNLLCAIAPNFYFLNFARLVTALCHGAFFGIGAVVAASLVQPHRRAQAIALVITGLTLASVIGVPIGTYYGQIYGWRAPFYGVAFIGLIAVVALFFCIPKKLSQPKISLRIELASIKSFPVLMTMFISMLTAMGFYGVFTYIAPMLEQVTHINPSQLSEILLSFGIAITLGNLLGGRMADWHIYRTLLILCLGIAASLCLFRFTLFYFYPAVITLFLWGILAFAIISPLQMMVVNTAISAPNMASTLNQSAFHIGIAIGSAMFGLALHKLQWFQLPLLSMVIILIAFVCSLTLKPYYARAQQG